MKLFQDGFDLIYEDDSEDFIINSSGNSSTDRKPTFIEAKSQIYSPIKNQKSRKGPKGSSMKDSQISVETILAALAANDDEFSVFGKHVANEIRQINNDFVQQTTKMKINTILFEARTEALHKSSNSIPTSVKNGDSSYELVVGPPVSDI